MRHHQFEPADSHSIAVLIKGTAFNKQELINNYVAPLAQLGVVTKEVIAFTLKYDTNNKAPVKYVKEYLLNLLPALDSLGVKYLYVADSVYFKVLAGQSKAEPHHGYVLPCKIKGYEHIQVVLGLNYQTLIYNPSLQAKLDISLKALASAVSCSYQAPGSGIIHSALYPSNLEGIAAALESLHQYPELTCDIEAFSLKFNEAGIGTLAFACDQHNGLAFACDYFTNPDKPEEGFHGWKGVNHPVRDLLREFFSSYEGEITWHSSTYDLKVLIYVLWMRDLLDTEGLLTGLKVMTRAMHDTKIIAYLATNSTAGNVLGLKALAHEFAGNWAQEEIKDIRRIPLDQLLQYNLVDCLSTWYVKNKFTPIMRRDNQEDLYKSLMLPSLKDIIQMELTGMPMSAQRVQEVKEELQDIQAEHLNLIRTSPVIRTLELLLQTSAMETANSKLKVKQHPLEKFADLEFNPNSNQQLQRLLYEQLCLPVLDKTDTGQPATGADTLEKLVHHVKQDTYKGLLNALIGHGKVSKILNTFIPAFEQAIRKNDGMVWLHGNFNLGGTVSGRLSSSSPNLQNLPATSTFGKLIKSCFMAPPGWVMAGADFHSLEDYISALTTKDSNKMSVYERGFDGHCLRAAYYFRDQCPDIDASDPVSVNSMKKKYPQLRQDSKMPTFALIYQGTWHTLKNNLGIEEETAKSIEANYHELYKESDEYIQRRLEQASKDGYVDVAFGLRVRTPLLSQVVYGSSRMPYEASAEGRTAGNAMGQSYGLLNSRAANEFMEKVRNSRYRQDIKLIGLIHDAIYVLIRDDIQIVEWANRELVKAMQWQELPEIQHPTVKLGAELDVFYKGWHQPITLSNDADISKIRETVDAGMNAWDKPKE